MTAFLLLFWLGLGGVIPSQELSCPKTGPVTYEVVMRQGPSDESAFVAKLYRNELVNICYESKNGEWLLITYKGQPGWVEIQAVSVHAFDELPTPLTDKPPLGDPAGDQCRLYETTGTLVLVADNGDDVTLAPGDFVAYCGDALFIRYPDMRSGTIAAKHQGKLKETGDVFPGRIPFGGGTACLEFQWQANVLVDAPRYFVDGEEGTEELRVGSELSVLAEEDGWYRTWVAGLPAWVPADAVGPPGKLCRLGKSASLLDSCPEFFRKGLVGEKATLVFDETGLPAAATVYVGTQLPVACNTNDEGECLETVVIRDGREFYKTLFLGRRCLVPIRALGLDIDPYDYHGWRMDYPPWKPKLRETVVNKAKAAPYFPLGARVPKLIGTLDFGVLWAAYPPDDGAMVMHLGVYPSSGPLYPTFAVHLGSFGRNTIVGTDGGVLWEPFFDNDPHGLFAVGASLAWDGIIRTESFDHLLQEFVEVWVGWKEERVMTGVVASAGASQRFWGGNFELGVVASLRFAVGFLFAD